LGGDFSPVTETQILNSYELGIKSVLLDGRLAADVALYYQEWINRPSGLIAQVVGDDNRDGLPVVDVSVADPARPGDVRSR
jgi:outer membrane receptor for ferric coprogen and ferric-rhodotorulic acid